LSSSLCQEDSYKLTNQDEKHAIDNSGTLLSIEGRSEIILTDTLRLKLWQYRQNKYYLKIVANNFSPATTAFVKDTYHHRETAINLADTTLLNFDITTEEASSASDRFMIIFKAATTLPLALVDLKAYQKEEGIRVEWTSKNEQNTDRFEVEKSTDGVNFEKVSSITPRLNNLVTELYSWYDTQAGNSNNFYRIKVVEKSGRTEYTAVVKVVMPRSEEDFTVYPNPVKGNTVNIYLNNIKKGKCNFILYNNLGQRVYYTVINHDGGEVLYRLSIPGSLNKGSYRIEVRNSEIKKTQTILLQ
jgi:hypothetical protein